MVQYIYFVKCPECEDENFAFFDEAKEFALSQLSKKPCITQVEINTNDFGECTDSCDLGTVWSWEDMMDDEIKKSTVFSKDETFGISEDLNDLDDFDIGPQSDEIEYDDYDGLIEEDTDTARLQKVFDKEMADIDYKRDSLIPKIEDYLKAVNNLLSNQTVTSQPGLVKLINEFKNFLETAQFSAHRFSYSQISDAHDKLDDYIKQLDVLMNSSTWQPTKDLDTKVTELQKTIDELRNDELAKIHSDVLKYVNFDNWESECLTNFENYLDLLEDKINAKAITDMKTYIKYKAELSDETDKFYSVFKEWIYTVDEFSKDVNNYILSAEALNDVLKNIYTTLQSITDPAEIKVWNSMTLYDQAKAYEAVKKYAFPSEGAKLDAIKHYIASLTEITDGTVKIETLADLAEQRENLHYYLTMLERNDLNKLNSTIETSWEEKTKEISKLLNENLNRKSITEEMREPVDSVRKYINDKKAEFDALTPEEKGEDLKKCAEVKLNFLNTLTAENNQEDQLLQKGKSLMTYILKTNFETDELYYQFRQAFDDFEKEFDEANEENNSYTSDSDYLLSDDDSFIESLVEDMEENEDNYECFYCGEPTLKAETFIEFDEGAQKEVHVCPQCEAALFGENAVKCNWCGETFDKDDCRYETDLGYLCPQCEAAIKSRGETLTFQEDIDLIENVYDFNKLKVAEDAKTKIYAELKESNPEYIKNDTLDVVNVVKNKWSASGQYFDGHIIDLAVESTGRIILTIQRKNNRIIYKDLEDAIHDAPRNSASGKFLKTLKDTAVKINKSISTKAARDYQMLLDLKSNPDVAEELKNHIKSIQYRVPLLDAHPEDFDFDSNGDPISEEASNKLAKIYYNFLDLPFSNDAIDSGIVQNRPASEDTNKYIQQYWHLEGVITFDCKIKELSQKAQQLIDIYKVETQDRSEKSLNTNLRECHRVRLLNALISYFDNDVAFYTKHPKLVASLDTSKLIRESIDEDVIELKYNDLDVSFSYNKRDVDDWDEWEGSINYTYKVDKQDIIDDVLVDIITEKDVKDLSGGLTELEKMSDEDYFNYFNSHFDDLFESHEQQILDYYRESAAEAAEEDDMVFEDNVMYEPEPEDVLFFDD